MAEYTLTIPAPAAWMNSNDRHGWQQRAKLTRAWRHAASWRAAAAINRGELAPITGPTTITATVHRDTNRGRSDASNRQPTIKAAVDGLVDAGVLPDDSDRHVTALTIRAGERVDGGQLVLTIAEVTP